MLYRQGDVLLQRVEEVPEGATSIEAQDGRIVLALGEETGHAHVIDDSEVDAYEKNGVLYLVVGEEAHVTHEEHDTMTLPAATYRRLDQVEATPWTAPRRVRD